MAWPDPRRDRALLGAWLLASFALSAASDPRWLGAAALASALLLRRGLWRNLRRVLVAAAPLTALLAAASWGLTAIVSRRLPEAGPYLTLLLRTLVLAFLAVAVLDRVHLLRALAPWPTATRLAVVALAQIHALRLLATESLLGVKSRLLRRPGAIRILRSAGPITGALLALSLRNARDVSDALRARGFE